MANNSLKGIGLLQNCILHLVSIGEKESIADIEAHLESKDLVEYLYSKYKADFLISFDNSIYSNESLNSYFGQYCGCIEGEEYSKYGITKSDDGLLLILALISNIIEEKCNSWIVTD